MTVKPAGQLTEENAAQVYPFSMRPDCSHSLGNRAERSPVRLRMWHRLAVGLQLGPVDLL
jgi:hypothetical protein